VFAQAARFVEAVCGRAGARAVVELSDAIDESHNAPEIGAEYVLAREWFFDARRALPALCRQR
jgi:hypothetical protein